MENRRSDLRFASREVRPVGKRGPSAANPKKGSALIVALWVLITLSLLVGAFAFDMRIEAGITSYYRKRLKAQYLARAGVEYAKLLLDKSYTAKKEAPDEGEDEEVYLQALHLQRGIGVSGFTRQLGQVGQFTLDIQPEQGRRNVNMLTDEDWDEILDQGNVPQDQWPALVDCFTDWIDPGDEQHLNGAESDDAFYKERGYECKNAPLDTVDELLLVKGFTPAIVYGGPAEKEGEDPYLGIAQWLTTWGDGKVNVNTASREVLLTVPGLEDYDVDDIIAGRSGIDKELGTKDDGYDTVDEVLAKLGINDASVAGRLTTEGRVWVRVVSKGEVQGAKSGIWAVLQVDKNGVTPLYWREEDMP